MDGEGLKVRGFHNETDVKGHSNEMETAQLLCEPDNQHIGNLTGGQVAPSHQRTKMRKRERDVKGKSQSHLGNRVWGS